MNKDYRSSEEELIQTINLQNVTIQSLKHRINELERELECQLQAKRAKKESIIADLMEIKNDVKNLSIKKK